MASTLINEWPGIGLPDFIGEGSGDQVAINGAVCAAKKGSFDGTGCVGMDEAVTGTVSYSEDMLRHVMGALAMSRACRVHEFRRLTSPARFFFPSLGQVSGGAPGLTLLAPRALRAPLPQVSLALGEFFLDGSVFLQSGIFLSGG